jgi:hypothetical protein
MRKLLPLLAASMLMTGAAAQAKPADHEAELARRLAGRVAGEPVHCIDLHRARSSQVIDGTAIVWDAGSILYVNRPRSGAEELDEGDTMVLRLSSTQLCNVDTIRMVDRVSGMMTGLVFLGDFVPYRRIQTGDAR